MTRPPDHPKREIAVRPDRSVIVQAPAGSGKTTLLAQRYLNLLTVVRHPGEILAITFTKKAATEMRHRVLEMLRGDSAAAEQVRARDAELSWRLLENPVHLKIQTIDSFAMELAYAATNNNSLFGFDIIEDAAPLLRQASERLLYRLHDPDDATASYVADLLYELDNNSETFIQLLSSMLAKRDQWLSITRAVVEYQQEDHDHVRRVLTATLMQLRETAYQRVTNLIGADHGQTLSEIAAQLGHQEWLDALPKLIVAGGKLRKRLDSKIGFTDAKIRQPLNKRLAEIHALGYADALAELAALPDPQDPETLSDALELTCLVLTLAVVELEALFAEQRCSDFAGLLIKAKAALRDENGHVTDLAMLLEHRIKHILVDEFQDTSRSQLEFFTLLTETWHPGDGNTFFAVGDPMQSIYRFRDADVEIFSQIKAKGLPNVPLEACELEANFRSQPRLVEWVNQLFGELFPATSAGTETVVYHPATPVVPQAGEAQVHCRVFPDHQEELGDCVAHLQALLAQSDADTSIAVLCRSRSHLLPLLDALRAAGIEWQATDMDLLANRIVVSDLLCLIRLIIDAHDQLALASILRSPMCGMELSDLTLLQQADWDLQAFPQAERVAVALAWARNQLHESTLREVVEGCFMRAGGLQAYTDAELEDVRDVLGLLDTYGYQNIDLQQLQQQLSSLYARGTTNAQLQVLTIHKAKGLEYDHVVVPFLGRRSGNDDKALLMWHLTHAGLVLGMADDACYTWLRRQERRAQDSELQRVLYVAATRAKQSLYLSFTQSPKAKTSSGLARYVQNHATASHSETPQQPSAQLTQVDLFASTPMMQRLPADYRWTQPEPSTLPTLNTRPDATAIDPIAADFSVQRGLVIHQALAWLAGRPSSASRADLTNRLQRFITNLSSSEPERLLDVSLRQVQHFVGSELGQWVLAAHDQHEAESPFSGIFDGELTHIVVDRMFVEDGFRWIIDYKTQEEHAATDDAALLSRYRHQLLKYSALISTMFPEPIRLALVLTDQPKLLELSTNEQ